jgi:predicted dehydrogenase
VEKEGTMRVIQVGLGGFGRSWAEIARAAAGVALVAAIDPSPTARAWAVAALGLAEEAVFPDLDAALDATAADAVFVITPPETHYAIAGSALRAGKHVLLEKPLATTFDEAGDLIREAAAMDRILMVSQNYRYRPGAVAARATVVQGLLGDLVAVRVRCLRDTRGLWPPDNFRYRMRHPFVLDMSIHHADLLRAITGQEVASIYARGWRVPDSPYEHDPAVAATMTLRGGATVLYEGDWATRGPETSWNGDWELIGERGRLHWTGSPADIMDSVLILQPHGEEPRSIPVPELEVSDRAASLAAFREAVTTGREPETSARDNIRSLAIVLGCVTSIESGDIVVPRSPVEDPPGGQG